MIPTPPPLTTKRRIKRFTPIQLGKMLAVSYGALGLLFIPAFLLMSAFATRLPSQQRVGMMALSTGFAFIFQFIYAAFGFVFGVIGAWVYNLIAKWIGGIEVEVE